MILFIALAKFKKKFSTEVVAEIMRDIEVDTKGKVKYRDISRTPGRYDTVVIFEALMRKSRCTWP